MRIPRAEGCGPPDGTNVASYVMNGIALICRNWKFGTDKVAYSSSFVPA